MLKWIVFFSFYCFCYLATASTLYCPTTEQIHFQHQHWIVPPTWTLKTAPRNATRIQSFATAQYDTHYTQQGKLSGSFAECYYMLDNGNLLILSFSPSDAHPLQPPKGNLWHMHIVYPPEANATGYLSGYCGQYNNTTVVSCPFFQD